MQDSGFSGLVLRDGYWGVVCTVNLILPYIRLDIQGFSVPGLGSLELEMGDSDGESIRCSACCTNVPSRGRLRRDGSIGTHRCSCYQKLYDITTILLVAALYFYSPHSLVIIVAQVPRHVVSYTHWRVLAQL